MEGRLELKLEKDFCIEVDTAIHESLQLTDFAKAFESLLSLEKQTRVGAGT